MWIKTQDFNDNMITLFITDKEFDRLWGGSEMEAVCVGGWRRIKKEERKQIIEDLNIKNDV